jgi:hypothetical protein
LLQYFFETIAAGGSAFGNRQKLLPRMDFLLFTLRTR